jgi:hypothetical protein
MEAIADADACLVTGAVSVGCRVANRIPETPKTRVCLIDNLRGRRREARDRRMVASIRQRRPNAHSDKQEET